MIAYAIDQRGHGDSDWVASGAYAFPDFADDARGDRRRTLPARMAERPDCAALRWAASRRCSRKARRRRTASRPLFAAIVLVDITPRVDHVGVAKVQGFMRDACA